MVSMAGFGAIVTPYSDVRTQRQGTWQRHQKYEPLDDTGGSVDAKQREIEVADDKRGSNGWWCRHHAPLVRWGLKLGKKEGCLEAGRVSLRVENAQTAFLVGHSELSGASELQSFGRSTDVVPGCIGGRSYSGLSGTAHLAPYSRR